MNNQADTEEWQPERILRELQHMANMMLITLENRDNRIIATEFFNFTARQVRNLRRRQRAPKRNNHAPRS